MSRDLIDRQTVVDALDHVISHGVKSNVGECHFLSAEGVKEYVLSLPSAQPDLQPTCNQLANDLISRQDAIIAVRSHRIDINDPKKIVRKSYEDVIKELPSAQLEIIDLQNSYHVAIESKNLAKIAEKDAHDILEEMFGDRELYTINDQDKERIKAFVRSITDEWERRTDD